MRTMVYLDLRSMPEKIKELKRALKKLLPETRKYPGCQGVEVFQNQDDPDNLILVERWDSREHYQAYLDWRIETGVLDTLLSMLSQEPGIHYFSSVDA